MFSIYKHFIIFYYEVKTKYNNLLICFILQILNLKPIFE